MTNRGHFENLKMNLSNESTVSELFALLSILFNVISSPCFAQPLDSNASIINATNSEVKGMCNLYNSNVIGKSQNEISAENRIGIEMY